MKMQIISWNVRGLHDPDKGKVIKSCLLAKNPSLVCLCETKTSSMTLRMIRRLGIGWTLGWGVERRDVGGVGCNRRPMGQALVFSRDFNGIRGSLERLIVFTLLYYGHRFMGRLNAMDSSQHCPMGLDGPRLSSYTLLAQFMRVGLILSSLLSWVYKTFENIDLVLQHLEFKVWEHLNLKVNGKWLIEEEDLQGEISSSSFCGSLFENPRIRRPDVGVLSFEAVEVIGKVAFRLPKCFCEGMVDGRSEDKF
ncbi:hypothetical protein AAG906_034792 [Vitis piasezkii]